MDKSERTKTNNNMRTERQQKL